MISLASNHFRLALALATALSIAPGCASVEASTFDSPEAAMQAAVDAADRDDPKLAEKLFGADGIELLRSGDPVADREDADNVKAAIREKLAFEQRGPDEMIALIGNDAWPFPIPLVRDGGKWSFDVDAGIEEITNRRIGRNELSTIATMHEYVDAQREYASKGRDGNPPAYARRLISSPGKHDGLYWPAKDGDSDSPLGELLAQAAQEGYSIGGAEPVPYHGYYFRSLEKQGARAPGGAKEFVDDKGRMSRGFAMLAWPAKYGNSGVMSFLVDRTGVVYQRDLGPATADAVRSIKVFDPDSEWAPAHD
jgi:hypothetical protein